MLLPLVISTSASRGQPTWRFADATDAAHLRLPGEGPADPAARPPMTTLEERVAGGVASGDLDGDGLVDLYVVSPRLGRALLFRNQGDGTFAERAALAHADLPGARSTGPLAFDFDGDERLDLFVGAIEGGQPALLRNQGDGSFADVTAPSGLRFPASTVSASAGDFDGDGWLDLFLGHWDSAPGGCHLWHNERDGHFSCADASAGLGALVPDLIDRTFTGTFTDLDGDRRPDLLVTADFGQSTVWMNEGGGHFRNATTPVISDENGMGSAVGDFDGDGRLDWFVSSVFDDDGVAEGDWGVTGNRLYRGLGAGVFADVTDQAGVRDGNWGWGASFADLDNDGRLDLVQVDGWPQGSPQFRDVPARVWINGGGRFTERAAALGLDDRGGGRGVVVFDYDGDGDLDVFVANNDGSRRLWRNDGGRASGHFLKVAVAGSGRPGNPLAVGARITIAAGGQTQRRELRAGSNYASQDPLEAHFGLGPATAVDRIEVVWPDGQHAVIEHVEADRRLLVTPAPEPRSGC